MSFQYKITLFTPTYNRAYILETLYRSIQRQTFRDFEWLIVDDGSPDRCPAMCDAWAERDDRIRVIHKSNGGAADARNAGIDVAKGSFIGFVDSDDYIAAEMYERLYRAIIENRCDIAACATLMVWEDEKKERPFLAASDCVMDTIQAQAALLEGKKLKQTIWYMLYRKQTIAGISFPVGKSHEDVFWLYRALGSANSICMISYIGYYYTQREDNTTMQPFSLKRLDSLEALAERQKYFEELLPELASNGRRRFIFYCMYNAQQAMKTLVGAEREIALETIETFRQQHRLQPEDYRYMSIKQRFWAKMANNAFMVTCIIRNALHIGL